MFAATTGTGVLCLGAGPGLFDGRKRVGDVSFPQGQVHLSVVVLVAPDVKPTGSRHGQI